MGFSTLRFADTYVLRNTRTAVRFKQTGKQCNSSKTEPNVSGRVRTRRCRENKLRRRCAC